MIFLTCDTPFISNNDLDAREKLEIRTIITRRIFIWDVGLISGAIAIHFFHCVCVVVLARGSITLQNKMKNYPAKLVQLTNLGITNIHEVNSKYLQKYSGSDTRMYTINCLRAVPLTVNSVQRCNVTSLCHSGI